MAGLPKCSDAMTNLRVTAGDACFLGTARMFTRPGPFWKAAVGSILESAKGQEHCRRSPRAIYLRAAPVLSFIENWTLACHRKEDEVHVYCN